MSTYKKIQNRLKRIKSIKKRLSTQYPRVTVFRSNKHIYAQLVNDLEHATIAAASDKEISNAAKLKPVDLAKEVGKVLGEKAKKSNIDKVIFDRRGYKYHGRVKALADGIREGGLTL